MSDQDQAGDESAVDELTPEEQAALEADAKGEPEGEANAEGSQETETQAETEAGVLEKKEEKEEEQAKPPPGFVPHGALHAERSEHRQTKQELAELKEKWARIDERLNHIQKDDSSDEPPNPEEDVFGAVKWVQNKVQQNEVRSAEQQKASEAEQQSQQERQRTVANYQSDAIQFRAQTPDFDQAYNHLVGTYNQQLIDQGIDDPAERMTKINEKELSIASLAMQAGLSPAKFIYQTAMEQGYEKPSGQESDRKESSQQNGAEKLDQIEKGQQASKSLSNQSGGSGGEMTGEALLNLDMDEFDAAISKMSESQLKQILGA